MDLKLWQTFLVENFNVFSWSGVLFSWLSSEGSFMYSSTFWEPLILRGTGFWLKILSHMFFSETCIGSFYADMRQVLRAGWNHWYHFHHPVQTSCIWLGILVHFCLLFFFLSRLDLSSRWFCVLFCISGSTGLFTCTALYTFDDVFTQKIRGKISYYLNTWSLRLE